MTKIDKHVMGIKLTAYFAIDGEMVLESIYVPKKIMDEKNTAINECAAMLLRERP